MMSTILEFIVSIKIINSYQLHQRKIEGSQKKKKQMRWFNCGHLSVNSYGKVTNHFVYHGLILLYLYYAFDFWENPAK